MIWTARHAPVAVEGVCYGRLDLPATLPAAEAAKELEAALPGSLEALPQPITIWSSPARRCRAPAELLARALGVPHRETSDLHELAFGAWEGRRWDDLEREEGEAFAAWMAAWQHATPPRGENVADLEQRVKRWMDRAGEGSQLVVAHAGVVRALDVLRGDRSWPEAMRRAVPHLVWQEVPRPPELPPG